MSFFTLKFTERTTCTQNVIKILFNRLTSLFLFSFYLLSYHNNTQARARTLQTALMKALWMLCIKRRLEKRTNPDRRSTDRCETQSIKRDRWWHSPHTAREREREKTLFKKTEPGQGCDILNVISSFQRIQSTGSLQPSMSNKWRANTQRNTPFVSDIKVSVVKMKRSLILKPGEVSNSIVLLRDPWEIVECNIFTHGFTECSLF